MKAAYADPPYIGQARRHYRADPQCAEVDHEELVARLMTYDRWALSCSCNSLGYVLSLCPEGVRVAAWVKPFCSYKKIRVAYSWEPVIFYGVNGRLKKDDRFVRDWVSAPITTKKGVHGAKPAKFCNWLLRVLDVKPGDTFDDLYPGSGAVTRAFERLMAHRSLESFAEAGP